MLLNRVTALGPVCFLSTRASCLRSIFARIIQRSFLAKGAPASESESSQLAPDNPALQAPEQNMAMAEYCSYKRCLMTLTFLHHLSLKVRRIERWIILHIGKLKVRRIEPWIVLHIGKLKVRRIAMWTFLRTVKLKDHRTEKLTSLHIEKLTCLHIETLKGRHLEMCSCSEAKFSCSEFLVS
jgi:hypothetical protein